MAAIADSVFDNGLTTIDTNATRLDIVSTDPGLTYATVTGNTLGNDTVNPNAVADGATDGRRIVIPAITAGSVTGTGAATHWALTNGTDTVYASNTLTGGGQSVTSGNTFTLDAISITIRDAT
jgi:hypothetical protein